jgi:uncharacterized MAPEG superfamily protein
MNFTILALAGYIAWTMILLFALAGYRTVYSKTTHKKTLKFDTNGADVGDFGKRLTRAHANCYESFSFIGATMLLALATGSAAITNGLALVVLLARVVQSGVHLISVSNAAISLRFVLFLVQFGIVAYWLALLSQKFI